jgi:hypothetical protein
MSHEHHGERNGSPLNEAQRDAWLELGGFIAAADGLSAEEIDALVASAAGPEADTTSLRSAIERGAQASAPSADAVAQATGCKPFIRLQCLSEVFHASGSDGRTEPEWERLGQVARGVLGDAKGATFVELCRVEERVGELRRALMEA